MSTDDEMDSWTHHSRWKNGRHFQSHAYVPRRIDSSRTTWPPAPLPVELTADGTITAPGAAAALLRTYGATKALANAEALKAQQPQHSDLAAFWDQVARAIERGIVEARQGGAL